VLFGKLSSDFVYDVMVERDEFVLKFCKRWIDSGISALIMPIWPTCAGKIANADKLCLYLQYALLQNMIGFPVASIPITRVTK
jgi:Asp-tRNA(Asn)/Glu-tRNA(Gln) amidotransferase A subunit family amidase